MRRISLVMAAVMLAVLFGFPAGTVAFAATDDVKPVLLDAFPVKDSFSESEKVEYILVFDEPGGINITGSNGLLAEFQLKDSPTPTSTELVITLAYGTDIQPQVEDITAQYLQEHPGAYGQGACVIRVAAPVQFGMRDNFMTGDYFLESLMASDMSGNLVTYGLAGRYKSDLAIPSSKGLEFKVTNARADKIAPVVQSIGFSPSPVSAQQTLTITVKAKAADGVGSMGYTLWVGEPRFYQYYPDMSALAISEPDAEGVVTVTCATVLPKWIPPGVYHIQQFSIRDKAGNAAEICNYYQIYPGIRDIAVTVENPGYVEPAAPTVTAFEMTRTEAQPADTVGFTVAVDSHGCEMEDYANLYISTEKGMNIDTPSLNRDADGRFRCTYTVPADTVTNRLHFDIAFFYKDGSSYQTNMIGQKFPELSVRGVFTGLDDISLLKGSGAGELLSGVAASNGYEGDMTSRITIANPPDLSQTGVYLVRYEIRSTLPVVDPMTQAVTYANYIGYRWVGVTDVLPAGAEDPFVTTDGTLAIGGATEADVSVQMSPDGGGFSGVGFASAYSQAGDYQVIKNNYGGAQAGPSAARSSSVSARPAGGRVLLCRIKGYMVTFASNGGSAVRAANVAPGGRLKKPADPARSGYTFAGWYRDAALRTAWNFSADTVQGDTTLYAKWNPKAKTAYLSGIKLSKGKLSPKFSRTKLSYTVNLGENDASVKITPVKEYGGATMKIDGRAVASKTISVACGKTAVCRIVVKYAKTTKTYTITVKRPKSSNNRLSALTASAGKLSPAFSPAVTSYRLKLPEGVSRVTLKAAKGAPQQTLSPAIKTVTLKNGQSVKVTFKVRAQSGAVKTYTVTVTRAKSANAALSSLKAGSPKVKLVPAFSPAQTNYTVTLPAKASSVTLTCKAASPLASVLMDGARRSSKTVKIASGRSVTVSVTVRAQAGNTRTYTVTVTRK